MTKRHGAGLQPAEFEVTEAMIDAGANVLVRYEGGPTGLLGEVELIAQEVFETMLAARALAQSQN